MNGPGDVALRPVPLAECTTRSTFVDMNEEQQIDWSGREHKLARTEGTINESWIQEVINDPAALWYNPDPLSKTGMTVRVIGHSITANRVFVVVMIQTGDNEWTGLTAYPANKRNRKNYAEGE